jgi:hypothetical protein
VIDIENLTLKQIRKLSKLVNGEDSQEEKYLGIRIVILQRGWIFIGKLYQKGVDCRLENAYVIRRWGTSKGLGELASEGEKSETVLDYAGNVSFHKLTEVANLECNTKKWKKIDE